MLSEFKPDIIRPNIFGEDTIEAFFTLKNPGVAAGNIPGLNLGYNTSEPEEIVFEKRKMLFSALSVPSSQIASLRQVHGSKVKIARHPGYYKGYDAMVTDQSDVFLTIQVADCAAVLLADHEHSVIGAAHAGWRGAAGGVMPQTVAAMIKLGADPSQIKAYVSPCISFENFEVGEEVADQFPAEFVDYTSYLKPHVDLKGYIAHQLKQNGVFEEHIEVDRHCTMEDSEKFYSYRREKDQSGRMMGIIKLKSA